MAYATDNFNRANGAPGANWTAQYNAHTIATNEITANTVGDHTQMYWATDTFGVDQYAQLTISTLGADDNYIGPAVRCNGTGGGARSGLRYVSRNTTAVLYKMVNDTVSAAVSGLTAAAATDTLRIEVVGTTVSLYKNNVLQTTYQITDPQLMTGSPGLGGYNNSGTTKGDNWEGGDLALGMNPRWRRERK